MNFEKNTLWKVPVYCLLAGVVSFYASLFIFTNIIYKNLDYISKLVSYSVYLAIFAVALVVGGKIFLKGMTKKEIFFSASVIICFMEFINILEFIFNIPQPFGTTFSIYISMAFQWTSIISKCIFDATENIYISAFVSSLAPYLFVIFGRNENNE